MRMLLNLRAVLSEDSDQLQRDLDINQVIDDTLVTTWDGGVITVAPSQADTLVPFPKVAAGKYLVIIVWSGEVAYRVNNIASQQLSIEVNPATTVDPLLPYQKAAQPGLVVMGPISNTHALTSLYFSNPSSTVAARVQVAIVGEAA